MIKSKFAILATLLLVVSGFNFTTAHVAKAAGPSVNLTISPEGSFPNYPGGNDYNVNVTWSSSGATRCESSGRAGGGNWGYNPDLPLSGSAISAASGQGQSTYVLTCFDSSGQSTTVSRTVTALNTGQAGTCDVFPEIIDESVELTVVNLTTSEQSSWNSIYGSEQGPDLPVSIGDSLLIEYDTWTRADQSNSGMNAGGNAFRYGTSTATNAYDTSGWYVVPSVTANDTSVGAYIQDCANSKNVYIPLVQGGPVPDLSCDITQAAQRVYQGDGTTYSFHVGPNNFGGAVSLSASISPATGGSTKAPMVTVDPASNNKVPPTDGLIEVSVPADATPNDNYIIKLTATGRGKTATCTVGLQVKPWQPDFAIRIEPNEKMDNVGHTTIFTVFADCTGGFDGDITDLSPQSSLQNVTLNLAATTLHCGSTTSLTVGNTGSVPDNQQSGVTTPQYQDISVTGSAELD